MQTPTYKINDKVVYKTRSGIITKVDKYSDDDLLDGLRYPDLDWVQTHPYIYTITYDIPYEFESILLQRKYPNEPNKWKMIRKSNIFEFINFSDVERIQ